MADPTTNPAPRRRGPLLAGLVAVAIVVAVVIAVAVTRGDDDPGATTTSTTTADVPRTSGPEDTAGGSAATVPVGAIQGASGAERCAAVLARLEAYVAVATETPVPDASVVTSFDEFTDEIFTVADGAQWGDELIEQLTTVRREWSNAAAAASDDDAEGADRSGAAALDELRAAIDETDCPTA